MAATSKKNRKPKVKVKPLAKAKTSLDKKSMKRVKGGTENVSINFSKVTLDYKPQR